MDEINRKYHEVANIFPLMQGNEFESLKADIAANGLREPIWIDADGEIIDGRNRHRACIEAGITPSFRTHQGNHLLPFVISLNLHRRHLDEGQRAMIAAKLANKREGRPEKTSSIELVSQAQAAELLNVSVATTKRAKEVIENGSPELIKAVEQGEVAVSAAAKVAELPKEEQSDFLDAMKRDKKKDRVPKSVKRQVTKRQHNNKVAELKQEALPSTVKLYCGDFREQLSKIPDNSIDFILTDPPYPAEFLPLWESLAELANRILKPGGYLFAYSGQSFLPDIYRMMGNHLDYQWTAGVYHKNGYTKIWKHDVLNAWKPVLIYSKGKPIQSLRGLIDMIGMGQGDKAAHDWSQPEAESSYYIEYMTMPGQTVLDPMMGSGTVISAAHKLERCAIGCEIDEQHYKTVRSKF